MTKKVWLIGAVFAVAGGVYLGTILSNSSMLSFLETPGKTETEQVAVTESPWTKAENKLSTKLEYESPAGQEINTITIAVENDTITSFEMSIETKNDVSIAYQKKFVAEVEKTIIGKKVSEISQLDTIAGASLTTKAFTAAFMQI